MRSKSKRVWTFLLERKAICTGTLIAMTAIGGTGSLKWRLHHSLQADSSVLARSDKQIIYTVDPDENRSFFKQHFPSSWPISFITRPIAYTLFEDIRKSISGLNDDAIFTFAKFSNFLESECNHFSSCLDLKTAIALARCGANPRLFTAPKLIPKDNKNYYGNKFRHLFSTLPSDNIHTTLSSLISSALKLYHPTEKELEDQSLDYYSGFESSDFFMAQNPVKEMGEREFLKICLLGVVSHSRIYTSISDLLSQDILDLLVVISREYRHTPDIMSLVLKVLANLSCNTVSAPFIKDTGCLKILAEYAPSTKIELALPAKRALHNLDRRGSPPNPILPPGIYQLHPEFGCDDCSYKYDVVFIHGLLGGIFRTWRRHDNNPNKDLTQSDQDERETRISIWKERLLQLRNKAPVPSYNSSPSSIDEKVNYPSRKTAPDGSIQIDYELLPLELEAIPSTPTQCWPRDWLAKDCPRARIIGVDFESFVSRWLTICPIETSERHLEDRSAELLKKLQSIGIGKRPVIWVTHSMGGLLLKSLLCQAASSDDPETQKISTNTKGIIFCSVPHRGTDMVILNTARRWMLLPTEEIEELSDEYSLLTNLNQCFIQLASINLYKLLSFGEMLETRTGLGGMKFKLVPYYSSDIGIGDFYPLRLDHLGTCKPWSRGSFIYLKTLQFIKSVSNANIDQNAPPPTLSSSSLPQPEPEITSNSNKPNGFTIMNPFSILYNWIIDQISPTKLKDKEEEQHNNPSNDNQNRNTSPTSQTQQDPNNPKILNDNDNNNNKEKEK